MSTSAKSTSKSTSTSTSNLTESSESQAAVFSWFDGVRLFLIVLLLGFLFYSMMPKTPTQDGPAGSDGIHPYEMTLYRHTGSTMGTTFTMILTGRADVFSTEQAQLWATEADSILQKVDRLMSTYKTDSDISRFNTSYSTDWFSVHEDTAKVVDIAQNIAHETGGALDVTVAPLVELWKFGPENMGGNVNFATATGSTIPILPTPENIATLKQKVGYHRLHVRLNPPALKKDVADLCVDLSAVAKGYGVDVVRDFLQNKQKSSPLMTGFLIEVGGETYVEGNKGEDTAGHPIPWQLGILSPVESSTKLYVQYPLQNTALATSGGYENYRETGGKRFSHIIDPRTGYPVEFYDVSAPLPPVRLGSVSVFADSCAEADALATAMFVLGPTAGLKLATEKNWNVLFLLRHQDDTISEVQRENNPISWP